MNWKRCGTLEDDRVIYRTPIFGGWLVAMIHEYTSTERMGGDYFSYDHSKPQALTFIPDPKHQWKIK